MQHTSYCNLELELQPTMIWPLVSQPPIALTTSSNDAAHSTLRPPTPPESGISKHDTTVSNRLTPIAQGSEIKIGGRVMTNNGHRYSKVTKDEGSQNKLQKHH